MYVRSCMMESDLNLANSNSAMAGLLHLQQCLWISKTNPRTVLLTPESRSELGMSVGIILQCNKLGSARGFGYTVSVPEDSRLSIILWYLDTIIGPFMGTLVFKILVVHMNLRGNFRTKGFSRYVFQVCTVLEYHYAPWLTPINLRRITNYGGCRGGFSIFLMRLCTTKQWYHWMVR